MQQFLTSQQHLRLIAEAVHDNLRLGDIVFSAALTSEDSNGRTVAVKHVQKTGQIKPLKPVVSTRTKVQSQFLHCEETHKLFDRIISIIGLDYI